MKVLTKYTVRELVFIFTNFILAGICIYLLFDFLDRVDEFIENKVSLQIIIKYFLLKIPLIICQISPGVFFLSIILFLSMLIHKNEMTALMSGGIEYKKIVNLILIISFIFVNIHFFFIQELGSYGLFETAKIWKEKVRKKKAVKDTLFKYWIRDKDKIIYFEKYNLSTKRGKNIKCYFVNFKNNTIEKVYVANNFIYKNKKITLKNGYIVWPRLFKTLKYKIKKIPADLDLKSVAILHSDIPKDALSAWKLKSILIHFKKNGSNVISVLTTLYGKLAYSFAIVILSILGSYISFTFKSIYKSVFIGLICIFFYYMLFVIGTSLANKNILNPFIGAWMANIVFLLLTILFSSKKIY
ncbi:MAG: LptF/LptG family permease [Desulfonauticus sp.]|nr:LptF/LptG family permease [Desulfonauticus sp.]